MTGNTIGYGHGAVFVVNFICKVVPTTCVPVVNKSGRVVKYGILICIFPPFCSKCPGVSNAGIEGGGGEVD